MLIDDTAYNRIGPTKTQLANAVALPLTKLFETGADDRSEVTFTFIRGVAFTDSATVIAIDQGLHNARVFDLHGKLVRTMGGRGAGPGELDNPDQIAFSRDTVFIDDTRALNLFTYSGKFINRVTMNPKTATGYMPHAQSLAHSARGIVLHFPPPDRSDRTGQPFVDTTVVIVIDPATGNESAKVVRFANAQRYNFGSIILGALLAPTVTFAISDSMLFLTGRDGKSITRLNLTGDPKPARMVLDAEPHRVTNAMVDAYLGRIKGFMDEEKAAFPNGRIEELMSQLKQLPHAENVPVTRRMLASSSGQILVERGDLSEGTERKPGTTVWDLFAANAHLEGRITLPSLYRPYAIKGDMIAGAQVDDSDVQTLAVYRIGRRN